MKFQVNESVSGRMGPQGAQMTGVITSFIGGRHNLYEVATPVGVLQVAELRLTSLRSLALPVPSTAPIFDEAPVMADFQDNLFAGMATNGQQAETALPAGLLVSEPGIDMRDIDAQLLPAVIAASVLVPRLAAPIATRAVPFLKGAFVAGTRVGWSSLPGWLQQGIVATGAAVGIDLLMDLGPLDVLPEIFGGGGGGNVPMHPLEGIAGHPGAHVVGSWEANGVTFYRLQDGRLAVRNKKGRWKVWRPKKPIVLFATGAVDLKTLLRADAVLNRQAKRIATMLNRRGQTRTSRAKKSAPAGNVVVVADGKATLT